MLLARATASRHGCGRICRTGFEVWKSPNARSRTFPKPGAGDGGKGSPQQRWKNASGSYAECGIVSTMSNAGLCPNCQRIKQHECNIEADHQGAPGSGPFRERSSAPTAREE